MNSVDECNFIAFNIALTVIGVLVAFYATVVYSISSFVIFIPLIMFGIFMAGFKIYENIQLKHLIAKREAQKKESVEEQKYEDILNGYKTFKAKELSELKKKYDKTIS